MRRFSILLPLLLLIAAAPNDRLSSAIQRLGVQKAAEALQQGRENLAMYRLATAWPDAEAKQYVAAHKTSILKTEWEQNGRAIHTPQRTDDLHPAALRALAEAARLESRGYYDAALDYGNNTNAEEGLYYLGKAMADRSLIDFAHTISQPADREPQMRSIAADLDSLEHELVAAYRPPASIDKHDMFIGASAMLKEARELDAAGLRYGALLRYLEAARRLGLITGPASKEVELALPSDGVDHTIAQIYIEAAAADPDTAPIIATRVLPRYFAALRPAPPQKPHATPSHTVTLVRWPYT